VKVYYRQSEGAHRVYRYGEDDLSLISISPF
jgi:hypothetical protein